MLDAPPIVEVPKVPLTNFGLRDFLQSMAYKVPNDDFKCKDYSVVMDPSGRILVSATFCALGDRGPYSISLEIAPVKEK